MIGNLGIFFIAAFFEIFGCFAFWLYFRLEKTSLWLVLVEKESFNRWDIIGAGICILGASVIFIGNQKVG